MEDNVGAEQGQSGWRDIATAPEDGSRFLATNGELVSVSYSDCDPTFAEFLCEKKIFGVEHDVWWPAATHWMPLPEPPK